MRNKGLMIVAALALACTSAQAAKLYKWVDSEGRVSYHDQPPPDASIKVEEKRMRGSAAAAEEEKALPEVVLYAAPKCGSCDSARAFLTERKVPFTEKNVEEDAKAQAELKKLSGALAVPTITVGERVMRGYLESILEDELKRAGYGTSAKADTAQPKP